MYPPHTPFPALESGQGPRAVDLCRGNYLLLEENTSQTLGHRTKSLYNTDDPVTQSGALLKGTYYAFRLL